MNSVANVLGNIVANKGISYSSISAKTGISIDAISRTFLGKRKLAADEMILISKAVDVNIAQIVDNCFDETYIAR